MDEIIKILAENLGISLSGAGLAALGAGVVIWHKLPEKWRSNLKVIGKVLVTQVKK